MRLQLLVYLLKCDMNEGGQRIFAFKRDMAVGLGNQAFQGQRSLMTLVTI